MNLRILDLDGSIRRQMQLVDRYRPAILEMQEWGPHIRMGCSFGRFRRFEKAILQLVGPDDSTPGLTFCGSGDFHHVSLAHLRRLTGPVNLLVVDNHPDWMRGVPFLHCGTWLVHAARLANVSQIFHLGGDTDFDNHYRPLAPWKFLESGKIRTFPAIRPFAGGGWNTIAHQRLRPDPHTSLTRERMEELLQPFGPNLAALPLYISLDKDVLVAGEAAVNWDSGHLTWPEVEIILETCLKMAGHNLAGMDVVGDWSPVKVHGLFRHYLHWAEHPRTALDPVEANLLNQQTNLKILGSLERTLAPAGMKAVEPRKPREVGLLQRLTH